MLDQTGTVFSGAPNRHERDLCENNFLERSLHEVWAHDGCAGWERAPGCFFMLRLHTTRSSCFILGTCFCRKAKQLQAMHFIGRIVRMGTTCSYQLMKSLRNMLYVPLCSLLHEQRRRTLSEAQLEPWANHLVEILQGANLRRSETWSSMCSESSVASSAC